MVDIDFVKTFTIEDPEDPTKTFDIEMSIDRYLTYKQNKQLIKEIERLRSGR